MNTQNITLETLAQAYNELNNKFVTAENELNNLRNTLNNNQAGPSNNALTEAISNISTSEGQTS